MSETTNTPERDDQQGTFVGGGFGRADDDREQAPTTAQQIEAEEEELPDLAAGVAAPAQTAEFATPDGSGGDPSGELDGAMAAAPADVEGVTGQPAPGERNEPV